MNPAARACCCALQSDLPTLPIITTQQQHTTALANIATDVNKLLDQKTVTEHRLERIEHWAQQVGQKVGLKLEL